MNKESYNLSDLFERAKEDSSWENSEDIRIELVESLVFELFLSIT